MGKKENLDIICCGNIAFDFILDKAKKSDEMTFRARAGGSVLNTAILLRRIGLSPMILSKTGTDFLSSYLLNLIKKEKLKTSYILRDKNQKTGLALAKIDKKGNSSYVFYKPEGKLIAFKKNQVPIELFKRASVFHTASTYSYSDFAFDNILDFMVLAKKENLFVSYDPNWREYRIKNKEKARGRIRKLLRYVDLLKLSETDALGITGKKVLSSALKNLPPNIIITLAEKGSFFWNGKKKLFSPSFKIKTIDTIGAGDAFTAGLLYRYSCLGKECFWREMKLNLRFASAVSSLVSQGKGGTGALKNLPQVTRFLKTNP